MRICLLGAIAVAVALVFLGGCAAPGSGLGSGGQDWSLQWTVPTEQIWSPQPVMPIDGKIGPPSW